LVGQDLDRARRLATDSRDQLAEKSGWTLDVFGLQHRPDNAPGEVQGYLEHRQRA
jgi:hypothetical protein